MKQTAILMVMACSGMLFAQQTTTNSQTTTSQAATSQTTTTTPKAQPNMVPPNKASNPGPSSAAQNKSQKNSVGKGSLTVTTAQPVSFWEEQALTSGGPVTIDFLYDASIGVLYTYREDDFGCANGQTGHGSVMQALNAAGNKAGKPTGSGWWAVDLSGGKCGSKESVIYGCKVDADGNPTECGAATINNSTGDIDVVALK